MKKIKEKFNISFLLDFLLLITLIIQDVDSFRLFGTQMYKYIIILMLFILLFDFIKNKKTIKFNKIYLIILFIIYLYLYIFSFSKTIIVPSVFFLIETLTFSLYIQSKKSIKELIESLANIILLSSLVLSLFSIIQFISYKLNIDFIYKFLTQNTFYLDEGRFPSIYYEPSHLCTIISAGMFISIYNIIINKNKINYLFLIILLSVGLLSGSVVVYLSLLIFIVLFYYIILFDKNKKYDKSKIKYISLTLILTFGIVFGLFQRQVLSSGINKVGSFLSDNDYSLMEEYMKKYEYRNIDINDPNNNSSLQNKIMYEQLANGSAYAMKSNFYIGLEKLKDKHLFGTGMFTHIVYYDEYMIRSYPNGYVRINYTDACSMPLRIFSEFGIIGLIVFIGLLIYLLILGIIKHEYVLLFIFSVFITQSMRLGEYNWILNCLSFMILLNYIKINEKYYFNFKRK